MLRTLTIILTCILALTSPALLLADTTAQAAIADTTHAQTSTLTNDSSYRQFVLDSLRIEAESEIAHDKARRGEIDYESLFGIMVPIIAVISTFLFLWRAAEAKKKVRLAMVERGMDPGMLQPPVDENSRKYGSLRWGMLFAGVGLGLLIGFLIARGMMLDEESTTLVVISSALCFGGAGLIGYHRLVSKMDK